MHSRFVPVHGEQRPLPLQEAAFAVTNEVILQLLIARNYSATRGGLPLELVRSLCGIGTGDGGVTDVASIRPPAAAMGLEKITQALAFGT